MGVSDVMIQMRWRAAGHYTRPLPAEFTRDLAGGHGLEVGGPSALFREGGLIAVYPLLERVDGVQWAEKTAWHELDSGAGYAPEGAVAGQLVISDDLDLAPVADATYDVVFSSHVIEHIANPLRALAAWRRVTRPHGHLLIVAPHMAGTFDHRRAVTTVEHMAEDFERGTQEDDLSHLEETLALHDRDRDAEDVDEDTWRERRRNNATTRLLHHHTFTTASLLALLDRAGLELLAAETRFPHDIYVLGRWPASGERAENAAVLERPRQSPFRVDR